MRRILVLLLAFAGLPSARAYEFWPGAAYDPRVPTFQQVLGYAPGERITSHQGMLRYLDALAAASPNLQVFKYGASWEDRQLVYAAIGSEANIKKLGAIRPSIARLADPRRTPEAEARKIMPALPAVVWLAAGIHGDEVSSSEAVMLLAYHLLAARNDKMVDSILANAVVLLDPLKTPMAMSAF